MQIVIDINDEIYKEILNEKDGWSNYVHGSIRTGTPLPKGHGRLIDADDIDNHIIGHVDTRSCPTIIEADTGEENG